MQWSFLQLFAHKHCLILYLCGRHLLIGRRKDQDRIFSSSRLCIHSKNLVYKWYSILRTHQYSEKLNQAPKIALTAFSGRSSSRIYSRRGLRTAIWWKGLGVLSWSYSGGYFHFYFKWICLIRVMTAKNEGWQTLLMELTQSSSLRSVPMHTAERHRDAEDPVLTPVIRKNQVQCISLSCALGWFGTVLTLREQIAYVFVNHLAKCLASNKLFINICWMELNQSLGRNLWQVTLTICMFSSFKRYVSNTFS